MKKYIAPELSITVLSNSDIITTSGLVGKNSLNLTSDGSAISGTIAGLGLNS